MAYGKDEEIQELIADPNVAGGGAFSDMAAKTKYAGMTDPLLTGDRLSVGDENYYRQEALGKVYDILNVHSNVAEGNLKPSWMDSKGDITDVIKSIATAKWESDSYNLKNKLLSEGMDVETASATVAQDIPFPLITNEDGTYGGINPESIYYPQGLDTNVVPSMGEPTDPGYNTIEEEVMGNMINTDKDLF